MRNVHETDFPTMVQEADSDGNFRSFSNEGFFQPGTLPETLSLTLFHCVLFIFTVVQYS